jgi:hypothetical protein
MQLMWNLVESLLRKPVREFIWGNIDVLRELEDE